MSQITASLLKAVNTQILDLDQHITKQENIIANQANEIELLKQRLNQIQNLQTIDHEGSIESPIDSLLEFPKQLQLVGEQIQKEFQKLQKQVQDQNIGSPQRRSYQPNTQKTDDIIKQHEEMETILIELEQKLYDRKQKKTELEQQIHQLNEDEKQLRELKKQKSVICEQLVVEKAYNLDVKSEIKKLQGESQNLTNMMERMDQERQELQAQITKTQEQLEYLRSQNIVFGIGSPEKGETEKLIKIDDLVKQHQALDDLMNDLQTKLSDKKKTYNLKLESQSQRDLSDNASQSATSLKPAISPKKEILSQIDLEQHECEILQQQLKNKRMEIQSLRDMLLQEETLVFNLQNQLHEEIEVKLSVESQLSKIKEEQKQIVLEPTFTAQMDEDKPLIQVFGPPSSDLEFQINTLKDTIKQQESQIEFLKFEIQQKDEMMGMSQNQELQDLTYQNQEVENRIQELKQQLTYKIKRKDQLESIVLEDSKPKRKSFVGSSDLFDLQEQLHDKNMNIVSLHDEISKLQKVLYEKEQELQQKDVELRYEALMKTNEICCEKADELVKKNLAMDELIHQLEMKLVEKESKLKELEYINTSKILEIESNQNNSFIRESLGRGSGIHSYDYDSDPQFIQQQQILTGFSSNLEQLKSKVECQKFELTEKDKIIEQLKQQLNELKKSNYNQQILATQDVSTIIRSNNVLQDQANNLVKQNLALQDVVHELEYKLLEKKNKQEEIQKLITDTMAEEIQIRQMKSDDLIKKNLELDQKIQQMESRLVSKQQQYFELEQRLSQHQRSMPQPLQVFHEDQDIIQDHNSNLSELTIQIAQITESVRQLSQDDIELEFLQKQKKEKQSQIEQLKLFIQSSTDVLQDLQHEQQIKSELIEKMKAENKDFETLITGLSTEQHQYIETALQSKQNAPNWLNENAELSKKLNELQNGSKRVKEQIKNLDSLILDLQIVVKEKQEELLRISQENYQLSILTRKQKQKRDHLLREQMPLGEKVGLLEQQVNDLLAEVKRLEPELAKLFQQAESAKQVKQTKEQQIATLSEESSVLDQNIGLLKDDIEQGKILEQQLKEQALTFKQKNALIEQEIKIYTEMNLDSANINKKIEDLTTQISEEKALAEQLEEELQIHQEQVNLLVPQKEEIQKLYQQLKSQYDDRVKELSDLQKVLQKQLDSRNQVVQELNYIKLFTDDQVRQCNELQIQRNKLEDSIRQECTLKNAIEERADRIQQELENAKQAILIQVIELDKWAKEKETREEGIKKLQAEVDEQKKHLDQLTDQQMKQQHQLDMVAKLDKDMENLMKDIYEKEGQVQQYEMMMHQKELKMQEQKQKCTALEEEYKFYQKEEEEIKKRIADQDVLLSTFERDFRQRSEQRSKIEDSLAKIEMDISDLEEMMKHKDDEYKRLYEIQEEVIRVKQEYYSIQGTVREKQEQISEFEKQRSKLSGEILKEQEQITEINQEIYQIQVKEEEMKFQIKEKTKELESLNEQFRKVDDDIRMMEAMIQLKEKELNQYQKKKESLMKDLEQTNTQVVEVKKRLNKKKLQKSVIIDPSDNDIVEEEITQQISSLNTKNLNLKDDLQRLVQSQSQPVFQPFQMEQSAPQIEQIQQTLKEREKKIEMLENTIQTLQQQNQERNNSVPSMFQSKMTVQPSFYFDDDPLLLELQDKFGKESEMLNDLQDKLKRTAERHHELALKLQEWADKENKLASELEQRRTCVEKIENELQIIFQKLSDKENEKVTILQRIYQLEVDNQELIEQEVSSKNRVKEKKDYVQVLYKNLIEMDEKLLQLRNRMGVYQREGRQLAEQVENLENEKEMKQESLQAIQEELEGLELEKGEKETLIETIKKEIQEQGVEKDRLETQFAFTHSKNQQLKQFIGIEEALYKRLHIELEVSQKRDQSKYENRFVSDGTQTQYESDQIESLLDHLICQKITKAELQKLKQQCLTTLTSIYSSNKNQISENVYVRNIIQLQQILIQTQESENLLLLEKCQSSKTLRIQSEELNFNQYELEQIDTMMSKSQLVEISINEHCLQIGDLKIPRQWIMDKYFDYDNVLFPLGVLHIVYKVSLCQVITLSLTGTKIIQLYSQI